MAKKQKPKKDSGPPMLPAIAAAQAQPEGEIIDQLTDKERLFITYYCGACQFNGSKAARWAGYSEHSCASIAAENLRKPHIQQAVKAEMGKRAASHDELVSDIIEEYCKLAFSNITNAAEFNTILVRLRNGEDLPGEISAAIKSVNMTESGVKVELYDKRGALADLAKILGMLTDDFRVRDEKHETIVERLYKQRMAKQKLSEQGVGA